MATLERIRSKGVLLLIVIGLAMVAFIVGDFLNNSSSWLRQSEENIIDIDGQVIKYDEYQSLIKQLEDVYKIEYSISSLDENTMIQVRNSVWQSLLKDILIGSEASKIGLTVSDNEIEQLTIGDKTSQLFFGRRIFQDPNTGRFDKNRMLGFLSQLDQQPRNAEEEEQLNSWKNYWMYFENVIRVGELENKYNTIISKAVNVNSLEAKMAFDAGKKTVDYLYVMKPYSSISEDEITISEDEIKEEYEQNIEQFKQEDARDIKYVAFDLKPSYNDFAKVEDWINNLKEEFSTTDDIASVVNPNSLPYRDVALTKEDVDSDLRDFAFNGKKDDVFGPTMFGNTYKMARIMKAGIYEPDSIKIRHIVLLTQEKEKTEALSDSIITALKGGADFAALASKYSKMSSTANQGGEIGWIKLSSSDDQDIISACLDHKVNEYFTYEENEAIQIIQVTGKTENIQKVKLAVIFNEVRPSQDTYASIYNEAKQFAANYNTLEKFDQGLQEKGYQAIPANNLMKNSPVISGVSSSRQIIRWAFEKEESGVVSDVFDCQEKFIVALVNDVRTKGYADLLDVKDEVKSMLIPKKKAEVITKQMLDINSDNIKDIASKLSLTLDTAKQVNFIGYSFGNEGLEPNVIAHAANAKENVLSNPIEGRKGVYVIQAINIFDNPVKFDAKSMKKALSMQYGGIANQMMSVLEDKIEIEDNRSRFY